MENANGLNDFPFMQRPPEKSDRVQGPISKMTYFTDTAMSYCGIQSFRECSLFLHLGKEFSF